MNTATKRCKTPPSALARGDLIGLDALDNDALAIFCFSDQRPLKGVAGYVDWRVCGALSAALTGDVFAAQRGEVMLLPVSGRFGQRRLFVFGLGPLDSALVSRLVPACEEAFAVMRRAGVTRFVFAAPSHPREKQLEEAFVTAVTNSLGSKIEKILVTDPLS